ncbi:hypothetical protein PF011_g28813 [Phytophthora fragariae]|uniref:Uncharacterized protein n=1 Tax=Phytophthora fragariae TaxID=53985 RepID=A0A6A3H3F1_9STRA|nr:hypothetical protein PF011_g28813 [Phytophthora fragariae]
MRQEEMPAADDWRTGGADQATVRLVIGRDGGETMEAESGGDPSDGNETAAADTSASREDGARVKLAATRTVTAKVGRAEDGMAAVVQRMSEDTKAKDEERAARA